MSQRQIGVIFCEHSTLTRLSTFSHMTLADLISCSMAVVSLCLYLHPTCSEPTLINSRFMEKNTVLHWVVPELPFLAVNYKFDYNSVLLMTINNSFGFVNVQITLTGCYDNVFI